MHVSIWVDSKEITLQLENKSHEIELCHKDNWVIFPIDDVPVYIMLLFNKIAGLWLREVGNGTIPN